MKSCVGIVASLLIVGSMNGCGQVVDTGTLIIEAAGHCIAEATLTQGSSTAR
ncbi:hypothetical protein JOF28_000413 [Leucobacter exalbidus]|uniref:Uncharacterized protein n=1 Tax=Leucobacter exalbidus TaxID=662960 RepID=A0A940PVX2_9MICO|nr:hypothetical protein [Leucobacter exalbidus]